MSFQHNVDIWMQACFGPEISADKIERSHRFIEEALELVQARGMSKEDALRLVDYVYGRPSGDAWQEIGGVMVTLAALGNTDNIDIDAAANAELQRIWGKIEQIRAKQATKPFGQPEPVAVGSADGEF